MRTDITTNATIVWRAVDNTHSAIVIMQHYLPLTIYMGVYAFRGLCSFVQLSLTPLSSCMCVCVCVCVNSRRDGNAALTACVVCRVSLVSDFIGLHSTTHDRIQFKYYNLREAGVTKSSHLHALPALCMAAYQ